MAHREDSGLLHEAVVWAYILFHEWDDFQAKCSHWPMMRTHCPCRPALVGPQQPESNRAQAFTRIGPPRTQWAAARAIGWAYYSFICGMTPAHNPTYFSMSGMTSERNARIGP